MVNRMKVLYQQSLEVNPCTVVINSNLLKKYILKFLRVKGHDAFDPSSNTWRYKPMKQFQWNLVQSAAAAAKSIQACPTLCDSIDGSPLGSSVPGILQARTLGRAAISFSNAWQWKVKVKSLSRARLLATPWTAAYQAPPSMGFSRQEYWSGLPLPSLLFRVGT